jgi:DNA-directed RNA polymerase subunit K/omega
MIKQRPTSNTFEFVVIAGARARQLLRGALPRVEADAKATSIAQQEVVEKKVEKVTQSTNDVDE